ncbi:hypothetical protein PsorP6_004569 [Peronosclerospora sorghi]|uniref:Uncharacterized protein n=1 Tax=Peronosclerospora sorghi TaxID=230839 RepID=A0ACC0VN60_9STRA|nr:hypothetical protein PsorP6_004569 [Peronosclerospora sorghi]
MCDGSARQTLHRTTDGKIQVTGTNFCLSLVNVEWQGHEIQIVKCTFTSPNWTLEDDTGRIRADKFCFSLNHASTENNVRITVRPCKLSLEPPHQWTFQEHDGTLRSRASETDQCVTAGYAFIQATAFVTPADRHVLLVLNENTQVADFAIHGEEVTRVYAWGRNLLTQKHIVMSRLSGAPTFGRFEIVEQFERNKFIMKEATQHISEDGTLQIYMPYYVAGHPLQYYPTSLFRPQDCFAW